MVNAQKDICNAIQLQFRDILPSCQIVSIYRFAVLLDCW